MKLETQKIVARNLSALRTFCAVSQTRFAVDLGLSRMTYSAYETGKITPDAEILYKISLRHGIKINDLFITDKDQFLSAIAGVYYYDDNLAILAETYEKLSAFSKGMLQEKANHLLEQDKVIQKNREALMARRESMLIDKNKRKDP